MDSKTNERILNKVKKASRLAYSSVKLDGRCTRNRPEMHLESGRRSPKAAAPEVFAANDATRRRASLWNAAPGANCLSFAASMDLS